MLYRIGVKRFSSLLCKLHTTMPLSSRCQSLGIGACSPSQAVLATLYWAWKHKIQRERDLAIPALRLSFPVSTADTKEASCFIGRWYAW
jgi:hypothetical protein